MPETETSMTTTCPACRGRGLIHWHPHWDNGHEPCPTCKGSGKIEDKMKNGIAHIGPAIITPERARQMAEDLRNNADLDAAEGGNPDVIKLEEYAADMIEAQAARIAELEAQNADLRRRNDDCSAYILGGVTA